MEAIKIFLKDLLEKSASENIFLKRNILKEYLQIFVLDFIYSHKKYSQLIFYGGSCLKYCHGLPRLSEDLDFVDIKKEIRIPRLAGDLEKYFTEKTDLKVKAVLQKFRIYLKFPLLHELNVAAMSESDLLFLKVEIFSGFDFCKKYQVEIIPLFKFNKTILIRTFDLPTLMATKIQAVLSRKWERTDKKDKVIIKVKGRDYFDLMWYLEKRILPNLNCFADIKDKEDLKNKLKSAVERIDARSIRLDLEPLIADRNLIENLSKNIKSILKKRIEKI